MKKREAGAPPTLFQAFNVSGKVREMRRGSRERKNIFLLFADVPGQDWLAHSTPFTPAPDPI